MIIISGSLAFDRILDFPGKFSDHILPDKIHQLNVSFLVSNQRRGFGGTAGNIAYTLSLLGIRTAILGIAGGDFAEYKAFLEKNEIETGFIKIVSKFDTSLAFGITDSGDNQIWGYYMGSDSLSDQLSTRDIKGKIDFAVIAPQNPKTMMKFSKEYTQSGTDFLFDPGMQLPWLSGEELKQAFSGAKIIIGNDYEISVMEKKTGISNIHSHFKDKIVITTLGENGSRVSLNGKNHTVTAAAPINTSDPAGAGDCFRSGFIAGFMRGFDIEKCAKMGSVAAAYTVEKFGTTSHTFTLNGFINRFKQNYGEDLDL